MQLIETHAHLYLPEFDSDRDGVVQRARQAGIEQILMPAIDASTHAQMLAVESQFAQCHSMMGLHPCSVNAAYEEELATVHRHLQQRRFVAIGEIGLDFYWEKTFIPQQYDAFERQCSWALEFDLPIVIHSRNAMDECIDVVRKFPGLKGVFHCFSGTAQQARQILELDFLLGIGGVVTYKNAGLDKVIAEIGIDRLVLETDAPYLTPVPYRGKRNESAYIPLVAEKIAAVTQRDLEEIAKITAQNAINLFKLS